MLLRRIPASTPALLLLALAACSDLPSTPRAAADGHASAPARQAPERTPRDVPAVRMDLPPAPRPWDGDPTALAHAVAQGSGYAVVARSRSRAAPARWLPATAAR
ncbi:MAG TPA: hypothetical protein VFQ45_10890 [Longimicrobium sp.]|nr:hypothetical protein [Longimicrobium sp.]